MLCRGRLGIAVAVVLHVSEAWGGGIVTATEWIASQAPSHEHHVLFVPRSDVARDPDPSIFTRSFQGSGSRRAFVREARRLMTSPIYDVVHAHSSWAGAVCRLMNPRQIAQFYSPHCFAFERRDINGATRRLFRSVESMAVDNTSLLVANGSFEAGLADHLGHRRIIDMPMIGRPAPQASSVRPPGNPRIVTLGRIAPQKDPDYFIRLVQAVRRSSSLPVEAVWIGAPDMSGVRSVLTANDVRITGWLEPEELAVELAGSTCYVHTAAWEAGAPLAMLDAARSAIPVVARHNDCLAWTGFDSAPTLQDHADAIGRIIADSSVRAKAIETSKRALRDLERRAALVDLDGWYGQPARIAA